MERRKTLGDYFSTEEVPRTLYTDQDLAEIARLLDGNGLESWSRVPRIYTVLRLIGQVAVIDAFLDIGMNDLWLPFHISQLPKRLSAFHREQFIKSQNMVLSKALDLENDRSKKHTHFQQGESFPFTIGEKLGSGGYASVDKVVSPLSGRTFARKKFRRTNMRPSEVHSFMTELQVLKRINHHHCVELVASYTDSRFFGLLICPVADCDLSAYYNIVTEMDGSKNTMRSFFGCLAHALQFLHDNKIRHRDVKPENILVKGNSVYLSDFGISLDWENLSRSTTTEDSGKSWTYCAPEVAHYEKRNSSSDVWSLGCVFLEMLTVLKSSTVQEMRKLFHENSGRARFYENFDVSMGWLVALERRGESSDNVIAHLIRTMIVVDPSSRDSARAVFASIVSITKESKDAGSTRRFCGECCFEDHDIDSSSEVTADDVVWAQGYDARVATSQSSPLVADDSPRTSISAPQSPRLQDLSVIDTRQEKHIEHESRLSRALRLGEREPSSTNFNPAEFSTSLSSSSPTGTALFVPQPAPYSSLPEIPQQTYLRGKVPTISNEKTSGIDIRRQLLDKAKTQFQEWPFTELGRIPILARALWRSEKTLLEAIQTDSTFMEHIQKRHPGHFDMFKSAKLADIVPIIYLFLLNGLIPNDCLRLEEFYNQPEWKDRPDIRHIMINMLIGFGADIRLQAYSGMSLLSSATLEGDIETVKALIDLDAHLHEDTKSSFHPIICAAKRGHLGVFRRLLETGHFDKYFWGDLWFNEDPLELSATRGHLAIVQLLLNRGAHHHLGQALSSSAENGHLDVVQLLLDKSGDLSFRDKERALHTAITRGDLKLTQLLLARGVDHSLAHESQHSALDIAVRLGHHSVVKALLKHDPAPLEGSRGSELLSQAILSNHFEVVQVLLNEGAVCRHQIDSLGDSDLYQAVIHGNHLIVEALIKVGAAFRSYHSPGYPPPVQAAKMGNLKVLQVFFSNGLGIDEKVGPDSKRLIHYATKSGHVEMVKYLLSQGADPTRKVPSWAHGVVTTPLKLANRAGHTEIVKILEEAIREWKNR